MGDPFAATTEFCDLVAQTELLASVCEAAEQAFDREDVETVLELALAARHVRAAVARASARVESAPVGSEAIADMTRVRRAAARARGGDDLLRSWRERPPVSVSALASPVGVVAFTEAMLPLAWDFDCDIALLFGRGLEAVAEVLVRCGQRRLIVYAPPDVDVSDYPSGAIVVTDDDELNHAIACSGDPSPQRVAARSIDDRDVSWDDQRRAVDRADAALVFRRVADNTIGAFAEMWVRQALENIPAGASIPSVTAFDQTFRGLPMIVVAPGPSLDRNLHLLHQFRGKAVIATFSHTLSVLAAAGVDPDLVITVDANALQYHFDRFPLERVGAMVSGLCVNPDLFRLSAPRHVSLGANGGIDSWLGMLLGDDFTVGGGGSVATTAAALGVRWGCDPIIFIGLDLSFSGDRYYASSSCDGGLRVRALDGERFAFEGWSDGVIRMREKNGQLGDDIERTHELPGYHGGTVPTSRMFCVFHDWFVAMARTLDGRSRWINATEGGAYIDGMEHIPLAEAYDRYVAGVPPFDPAALMDRAIGAIDLSARRDGVRDRCARVARDLSRARKLAARCARLADRAAGGDAAAETKLCRSERALAAALAGLRFLSILGQRAIADAGDRARNAPGTVDLLAGSRELFDVVIAAIDGVLPGFNAAVDALATG